MYLKQRKRENRVKAEERKLLLAGAALLLGMLLLGARRKTVSENKNENTGNKKAVKQNQETARMTLGR